jgi:hypothetical protein
MDGIDAGMWIADWQHGIETGVAAKQRLQHGDAMAAMIGGKLPARLINGF